MLSLTMGCPIFQKTLILNETEYHLLCSFIDTQIRMVEDDIAHGIAVPAEEIIADVHFRNIWNKLQTPTVLFGQN